MLSSSPAAAPSPSAATREESPAPQPSPRLRRLPRPTLFCLLLLAILVIQFTLLRAGLLLTNRTSAATATTGELARAFFLGLRFDLAVACYLLVPFVVVAHLPRIGLEASARRRRFFLVALACVVSIGTFVLLAEYEFFREFQSRYNQLAFQYLDHPATVAGMAWYNYPVLRYVLACAALTLVVLLPARHFMHRLFPEPRPAGAGRASRLLPALGVLVTGFVVAMRGGLQMEPLRWGDAYRSTNDFANQLGLNGLFCVAHAAADRFARHDTDSWLRNPMPLADARAVTRSMVLSPAQSALDPNDRTLFRRGDTGSPRLRRLPEATRPPNVVLVLMESFSARFVGAAGAPRDFTPAFSKLAAQGVFFDHAFSGGTHTHQGVFSTMLSFPNLPGHEYLMEQEMGKQPFCSLPAALKSRGYRTLFLYNGDFSWDNMRGFFQKQGVDTFIGSHDYVNPSRRDRVWGVADQDVFDRATDEFDKADRVGAPFFSLILTLSNHVPYDLPDPLPYPAVTDMGDLDRRLDAMGYADWCVGRFIERAKKRPWFDNTLFVFVGDHGFNVDPVLTEANLLFHHVPLLFYAPKLLPVPAGTLVHTAAGQSNVAPTILGLLDVDDAQSHWGRNLFATGFPDENFVYFKGSGNSGPNRALVLIRGDKLLCLPSTGPSILYHYDLRPGSVTPLTDPASEKLRERMQTELTAYVKSAMTDLTTYKAGPAPGQELLTTIDSAAR